jgi:hypothetical protein
MMVMRRGIKIVTSIISDLREGILQNAITNRRKRNGKTEERRGEKGEELRKYFIGQPLCQIRKFMANLRMRGRGAEHEDFFPASSIQKCIPSDFCIQELLNIFGPEWTFNFP